MHRLILRRVVCGAAIPLLFLAGCHQSPYDFPVMTSASPVRTYAMTGYARAVDEQAARVRVAGRYRSVCPHGVNFISFDAEHTDAMIGTKIMHYRALATCTDK